MNRIAFLSLIAVTVAACSDTSTTPNALRAPTSPSMAVNGPTGAHLVTGTPTPSCTGTNSGVSCNSFEIAGVGNTNATATLSATFSATVDCFNPGVNPNNPVESHTRRLLRSLPRAQHLSEKWPPNDPVAVSEPQVGAAASVSEPELDTQDPRRIVHARELRVRRDLCRSYRTVHFDYGPVKL